MRLPPDRVGHPAPADLAARREGLEQAMAAGLWRCEPEPEQLDIGGIRCLRFAPPGLSHGVVLHVHGGAFRIGCPEVIAPFAAALALRCEVTIVCPGYRLAPEHPFPAGLRDCLAVFAALRRGYDGPLVVSGDSAGGGIAASLAALAIDAPVPLAGLALLSPWLDLTVASASYAINADTDPLFSEEAAREAAALYLQGMDAAEPLASPVLGPIKGFPPTFISVGAGEVLLDDARSLDAKLRDSGVPTQLEIVPDMEHVAVTRDRALPGAARTFDALAAFIETVVSA